MILNSENFRRSGGLVLALVLIFLGSGRGVLEAQSERTRPPQWFAFTARLTSPAARNETRILRRGALLYPRVRGREGLYQPVVLCEDLKLDFDEYGVSQLVRVQGFCFAPGLKAAGPLEAVNWEITAAMAPAVAAARACREAWIRKGQEKIGAPWGDPPDFSVLCKKSFVDCIDEFSMHTQKKYGRSLDEARRDDICTIVEKVEKLKKLGYLLECSD